jgi:hypothetical protein
MEGRVREKVRTQELRLEKSYIDCGFTTISLRAKILIYMCFLLH